MEKVEIIKKVNHILVSEMEVEEKLIKSNASLKDDMAIDSLALLNLSATLHKQFKINMVISDLVSIQTLNDLYDYICLKIEDNKC